MNWARPPNTILVCCVGAIAQLRMQTSDLSFDFSSSFQRFEYSYGFAGIICGMRRIQFELRPLITELFWILIVVAFGRFRRLRLPIENFSARIVPPALDFGCDERICCWQDPIRKLKRTSKRFLVRSCRGYVYVTHLCMRISRCNFIDEFVIGELKTNGS